MMSDAERPESPGLDLGPVPAPASEVGYRVLARKYRPWSFDDLIGQDAMVRTLSNAFETGRIPQAWILTGVRGVGKTTTARILARALNYQLKDGSGGPTIRMPEIGVHCREIMESRHVDVLEMDAASHNGVDDVRQINEAVRYAPVMARYKVYILDEVHMLSGAAFNALLKTLEEPPPHAKFVFATTEIRKVPVTVLSRCQRFDLRRVEASRLMEHLQTIAGKEGIAAEGEALALIARAAEGSVRDALSLFDQAIAHSGLATPSLPAPASGGGKEGGAAVRGEDVRGMLGLADRARIIDLFEALMRGDIAAALKELRDQYESGADPAVALADLAEFTHFVTRVKVVPAVADDPSLAEAERTRGRAFATALSMRVLSRTWQMLFRGIPDVQSAVKPIAAAEMVLVRIAYAADLPTPDEVIRSLGDDNGAPASAPRAGGNGGIAAGPVTATSAAAPRADGPRIDPPRASLAPRASAAAALARSPEPQPAAAAITIGRFEDLVALAGARRDLQVKSALERDVRLVRFEEGKLEIALEPGAPKTLVNELARKLSEWTGRRWLVVVSGETGAPTVRSQVEARDAELKAGVRGDPLVKAVLARFPGAEIVGVRRRGEAAATPDAPGEPAAAMPAPGEDEPPLFDPGEAPDDD
jgi:DNA polymerase III subunit gamma/tau